MSDEPYIACLTVGDLIAELSKVDASRKLITNASSLYGARVILQTTGEVLICPPEHPIFKRERPTPSKETTP